MSHWLWVFGQTRLNYLLLSYIRNQSVIFTFVPHKQGSSGRVSAGRPDWISDRGLYHSNRLDELIRLHPSNYLVSVSRREKSRVKCWKFPRKQFWPGSGSELRRPDPSAAFLFGTWILGWHRLGTSEKNLIRRSHLDFDCWISVIEFLIVVRCLWFE